MHKDRCKNLFRRARWIANSAIGRDVYFRSNWRCDKVLLGESYGAWTICPDSLRADSVVYCVGVGYNITFDLALIQRFGVVVHAFDPTPVCIAYLKSINPPDRFQFHPWGLAAFDGEAQFNAPPVEGWDSFSMAHAANANSGDQVPGEVKRLSTVMKILNHSKIDLLKLDIEGNEYEVIDEILALKIPIHQLLIEFHHRTEQIGPRRTRQAVEALLAAGYRLFNVSPVGMEYSFLYIP